MSSINEEDQIGISQIVSQFRSELMADDNFSFWEGQTSRQRLRRAPTQAVVAAQRVTVADNEDLCHRG